MKTKTKKFIYPLVLLSFILIFASSCKKDEDNYNNVLSTITIDGIKFTIFKNQTANPLADAIQAQIVDAEKNYTINFYGTFNSNNEPEQTNTVSYVRGGNDTIVYYTIDPSTKKVQYGFSSVNGIKQTNIMKYKFYNGTNKALKVYIYNYNWTNNTGVLKYEGIIQEVDGVVYRDDIFNILKKSNNANSFIKDVFISCISSIAVVSMCVSFPIIIAPVSAVCLSTIIFVSISEKLSPQPPDLVGGNDPPTENTPIDDPIPSYSNPTTTNSPCDQSNINFTANFNNNNDRYIVVSNVTGGISPYSYSVNRSNFQAESTFYNSYDPGLVYNIVVKDANHCEELKPFLLPATASKIEKVSGDFQAGQLGVQLPDSIKVIVKDANGLPFSGHVTVDFTVHDGGTLSKNQVITNDAGTASVAWTLGSINAIQTVTVSAYVGNTTTHLQGSPLTFTYTDPYESIQIGTQLWMKKNLNIEKPNSWCYNNDVTKCEIYGRLYNWDAAQTACPSGWHLPSSAEWTTLVDYLGGTSVAGAKLRETGTAHWSNPNVGATNEKGFTALPGGDRSYDGTYSDIGVYGSWWSSTEYPGSNGYDLLLSYSNICSVSPTGKAWGFSVRCLKD